MHVRRLAIAALSLLLPLAAGACGDDSDSADPTSTTAATATTAADGSEATAPGATVTEAPTTTMTAAQFDAAIAEFNATLAAADGDFCKITSAANTLTVDNPADAEQAQALYEAFAAVLNAVADHLPPGSKADPDKLKSAATKLLADAAADGYDPAGISSGSPEALTDPEVAESMAAVSDNIDTTCK